MASNKHNNTLQYYSELLNRDKYADGGMYLVKPKNYVEKQDPYFIGNLNPKNISTKNPDKNSLLNKIFNMIPGTQMLKRPYNPGNNIDFDTAYHNAKSYGAKTFLFDGEKYNTDYKLDPNKTLAQNKQDELSEYGITSEYAQDKSPVTRNIHAGINPAAKYGFQNIANDNLSPTMQKIKGAINSAYRVGYSAITGKSVPNEDYNNPIVKDMATSPYQETQKDYKEAQDSWNLYMGYPQKNNTFSVSQTKPKGGTEPYYLSLNRTPNLDTTDQSNVVSTTKAGNAILNNFNLGDYTVGKGNGYQSYYDKWDINPFGSGDMPFPQVGKPLNIYGRKYAKGGMYTSPEIDNVNKFMQNYINSKMYEQRYNNINKNKNDITNDNSLEFARDASINLPSIIKTSSPVSNPIGSVTFSSPESVSEFNKKNKTNFPKNTSIVLDTKDAKEMSPNNVDKNLTEDTIYPHEFSHYTRDLTDPETIAILNKQKNSIINTPVENYTKGSIYREYLKGDSSEKSNKNFNDYLKSNKVDHDSLPNEQKADLDAIRYLLFKNNIYDTSKRQMNLNDYQKALSNPNIKTNPSWLRLNKSFTPKNIIWLNNNIAKNNTDDTDNNA